MDQELADAAVLYAEQTLCALCTHQVATQIRICRIYGLLTNELASC